MMRRRRLLWILYTSYVLVVLLAVVAISGYSSRAMKKMYRERAAVDLVVRLRLMTRDLPLMFPEVPADSLTRFCREQAAITGMRITLISPARRLLADSDSLTADVESITYRSEFLQALAGKTGIELRRPPDGRTEVLYVALPVWREGDVHGALRAAIPLQALIPEVRRLNLRLAFAGAIVALLAALVTLLISRWISRPVADMERGAERFSFGDFSEKVAIPHSAELGGLAIALNHMAEQLDDKIRTVTLQRNEQEAILASLREAVIAVDMQERVLFVNRAAAALLEIDAERALGALLPAVIRNSHIQQFVSRLLNGNETYAEAEVVLTQNDNRTVQITGTRLRNAAGAPFGVVIVLNDITRLRRLELIRKDFVANVSHELKTPVTSIKGFVETLREGAVTDPETARSFLERIASNTERLNAIIDDLLTLSRVEQDGGFEPIPMIAGNLGEVAKAAIATIESKARENSIPIELHNPENVVVRMNSTLLEQAVSNLLDNAIKYSEPGSTVRVEVAQEDSHGVIRVQDHGVGIAANHLPRIFERFYRVDRARSRKLGGTGLGLSIVKHIAQAHGGSVAVESTPGKGSTFSIRLPLG